jgi:hypothetical protein
LGYQKIFQPSWNAHFCSLPSQKRGYLRALLRSDFFCVATL